jgi:predicted ester cyclase
MMAEDVTYHDRARGLVLRGRDEYRRNAEGWVAGFSNADISQARYIDAGNVVVAQFIGHGHNDGMFGQLVATGNPASFDYCEIIRFGEHGKVVAVDAYYDQLSILKQLGHLAASA